MLRSWTSPWIGVALALVVVAGVLLIVGRRARRAPPRVGAPVAPRPTETGLATWMRHTGVSPAAAATALGVDERELARRVAAELGLLPAGQPTTRDRRAEACGCSSWPTMARSST